MTEILANEIEDRAFAAFEFAHSTCRTPIRPWYVSKYKWWKSGKETQKFSIWLAYTGIGVGLTVRCERCKSEMNITDYSCW